MENIITQCNRNWYTTGWWQKGDEFYQVGCAFTLTAVWLTIEQITVDGVN
jgi:hypothetical protein